MNLEFESIVLLLRFIFTGICISLYTFHDLIHSCLDTQCKFQYLFPSLVALLEELFLSKSHPLFFIKILSLCLTMPGNHFKNKFSV